MTPDRKPYKIEKEWRYAWTPTFCYPGKWVWFNTYLEVRSYYITNVIPEILNYAKGAYEIR